MYWKMALVLLFTTAAALVLVEGNIVEEGNCRVSRCNSEEEGGGPTIHFPFRLKNTTKEEVAAADDDCGNPAAFQLSCGSHYQTIFQFQYLVNTSTRGLKLSFHYEGIVEFIDYRDQFVYLYPELELTDMNLVINSASSVQADYTEIFPFNFTDYPSYSYNSSYDPNYPPNQDYSLTFFNCSSSSSSAYVDYISFLSTQDFRIYAYRSTKATIVVPFIISCTKMFNISRLAPYFSNPFHPGSSPYYSDKVYRRLKWSTAIATGGKCEAKYCKFNDINSTTYFHPPNQEGSDTAKDKLLLPVILIPSMLSVVVTVFFLWNFIRLNNRKKKYELKIKTFIEDYKALKPTRYSYTDIKKISNQFRYKLGQGGYGSVFKGQISSDIQVAVKVLHNDSKTNGDDFINEVGTIGTIHHVNVVRLLGYCADGCDRALVYEFQPNHSLEKFVYSRENHRTFIGWQKMQQIALGTAKGIEYLHQGCAQQILHFDIKPHNILLDKNFNPKISDFGLAKLCNKGQSIVSMTMARGTIGYIAPEVFSRNFGKVSAKSDVYSFGMLLLEMVGGKNNSNVDGVENTSEVYFPEWIFHQLEEGRQTIIQIENEDDSKIARKLTIVGLWCIGWHPVDRPSMKVVIQMLEGDDCPAMPPNPFSSTTTSAASTRTKSNINDRLQTISESE